MSDIDDNFLEFYINTHPAPQPMVKENSKPMGNYPRIILCDFCNKALPKRLKIHQNICQEPQKHRFCSKECKEKWCYKRVKN